MNVPDNWNKMTDAQQLAWVKEHVRCETCGCELFNERGEPLPTISFIRDRFEGPDRYYMNRVTAPGEQHVYCCREHEQEPLVHRVSRPINTKGEYLR